ncbi:MFS transporter [Streptomyces malaysiensis]|uniref:MFS transporter n=1 Tax=Streptomyces malaysiensis TaxID=92644 RepID=UPI0033F751BE
MTKPLTPATKTVSDPWAETDPQDSGALEGYRELIAVPGTRGIAVLSLLSKFPAAMFSIAVLLFASPEYSASRAALGTGTMLFTSAISGPLRGRLVDRGRRGAVLGCCLAGYLVGMTGLVLAVLAHLPFAVFLGAAAVAGLCFPPVGAMFLAYWNAAAPTAASRASANALESALIDLALVTGPLVATLLSTAFSPVWVFVLSGVEMAVVVALLGSRGRAITRSTDGPGADTRRQRIPARLYWIRAALLFFCCALGSLEIALPIQAQANGRKAWSGLYLTALSIASIAGAMGFGVLPSAFRRRVTTPWLLASFLAGTVAVAIAMAWSPLAALAVCPLAGIATGATFSALFGAVAGSAPARRANEVQSWGTSIVPAGFALGTSTGASLASVLGPPAFAVVAVPALITAIFCIRTGELRTSGALHDTPASADVEGKR